MKVTLKTELWRLGPGAADRCSLRDTGLGHWQQGGGCSGDPRVPVLVSSCPSQSQLCSRTRAQGRTSRVWPRWDWKLLWGLSHVLEGRAEGATHCWRVWTRCPVRTLPTTGPPPPASCSPRSQVHWPSTKFLEMFRANNARTRRQAPARPGTCRTCTCVLHPGESGRILSHWGAWHKRGHLITPWGSARPGFAIWYASGASWVLGAQGEPTLTRPPPSRT